MPAQQKYIALVIARKALFVNADGTQLDQQPAEMESMLDAFKPVQERKYMFVEVYSNIGQLTGNTMRELLEVLFASSHDAPKDSVLYFTRKAGKPYQSYPVGQTWLPTA